MTKEEKLKEAKRLYKTANADQRYVLESLFPELVESEDERIRKDIKRAISVALDYSYFDKETANKCLARLEKQGKQHSAIRWYDVSLIPQEMEELLVEWDSEDATWHEIAFYHVNTKTFWNGTRQVENVTRWCYIDDIIEQSPKPKWTEDDNLMIDSIIDTIERLKGKGATNMKDWLELLKQRMEE